MPIDKVASTPGNPVFGLSPENFREFYKVRSRPWIVDGPGLGALPRNPNLNRTVIYNQLLAAVLNQRTQEYKGGPTGLLTEMYKPGGLLYKEPARRNV